MSDKVLDWRTFDVTQLKAFAYEHIINIDMLTARLRDIQGRIAERMAEQSEVVDKKQHPAEPQQLL